ncbi:hypothetical protein [Rhodomicrobium lacus]|uniref:hypothetical protein n=1 Tax=Rhodomicrobium lacus TaxID=2498452 RepID=UPI000F8CED17|nr:hypothetical protein [Rhodomicrobium lacus]
MLDSTDRQTFGSEALARRIYARVIAAQTFFPWAQLRGPRDTWTGQHLSVWLMRQAGVPVGAIGALLRIDEREIRHAEHLMRQARLESEPLRDWLDAEARRLPKFKILRAA